MNTPENNEAVIFTRRARCRDCYRCLRICPVKAIRMENGQAHVIESRCLACGTCIRECPQQAKTFRRDIGHVTELLGQGAVAASVAPSFAGWLNDWERRRLPSALRRLGFQYVTETAAGAYAVAQSAAECFTSGGGRQDICTACPAAVRYVQRYQPSALPRLMPLASPMQTHARMLKHAHPGIKVVFIGPCIAKKTEVQDAGPQNGADAALTFIELQEWLERENITLRQCEESRFDPAPCGEARLFPLPGGLARTAALETGIDSMQTLAATGFTEIQEALEAEQPDNLALLIEPLFCPQGCINGAAWPGGGNLFERRRRLLEYAVPRPTESTDATGNKTPVMPVATPDELCAEFKAPETDSQAIVQFSEPEIHRILEQTGKASPEDQLNCGACGYASCRDKAIAVLAGMAELEMCIPYMRRLAERRTDRIIETTPNGILITDEHLNIISMNPALRKFFVCSDAVLGKHLSYLMDTGPFEQLLAGSVKLVDTVAHHPHYNLVFRQLLYRLPEEKQLVGIFVNLTRTKAQQELQELKRQTLRRAGELLEHQVNMAQQMAQFLGESTARGEELVRNLTEFAEQSPIGN